MKRGIVLALLLLMVLLVSNVVSAEVILKQQPKEIYNIEDVINIPVTVKTSTEKTGIFNMDLLCGGYTLNFYKNGVSLKSGEEKDLEASLVLSKSFIGNLKGACKIKAYLLDDYKLTNEFKISDSIIINIEFPETKFDPQEKIFLEGTAVKANGQDVDGYIKMNVNEGNTSFISLIESVDNGFFELNFTILEDMPAGTYLMTLNAYEQNNLEEKTNTGFINQNIEISQTPKNIEVLFEEDEIFPGKNLSVKAILRDQTGEKILNETSFITLKDNEGKILEQTDKKVDEFFEYHVKYNTKPGKWTVFAISNKLSSESKITILEKESVNVKIINKTVIIKNTGNAPYNNTVLIKIGNEPLNIPVYLSVDEEEKYILSAPDGEYKVEVMIKNESYSEEGVLLTGKSISVREASESVKSLIRYPLVWIFLIALLGFVAFIVFKRSRKQSFIGYSNSEKKMPRLRDKFKHKKDTESFPLKKNSLVKSNVPALLSLSIKGNKQSSVLLCLHVNNLPKLQSKENPIEETIQNIVNLSEKERAATYEAGSHIFFIFAPIKTKTFGNEKIALSVSRQIKQILEEHNRKFKDKIDYGISLTKGTLVAKQDEDTRTGQSILRFTPLGSLIAQSKKLASHSKGNILLDSEVNSNIKEHAKTKKHKNHGKEFYTIEEIKNSEENKKFIRNFLDKLEHGDKKSSDSEKPVEKE